MGARKISEQLFCSFTQEEMDSKGQSLSSAMLRYDEVEDQNKEASKTFTEELKFIRGNMRDLSKQIRRKGEMRPVDCRVMFHVPEVGIKRIVRLDTGEMVREEAMSSDERQENLFGEMDELNKLWGKGPEPEPPQPNA